MRAFSIHSSTMRRFGALFACLLWLGGFEVVPQLHTAFHAEAGHHHHEGASEHHETPAVDGHGHEPEHHADAEHHVHAAPSHGHAHHDDGEHHDADAFDELDDPAGLAGLDELDRLDELDELEFAHFEELEHFGPAAHHAGEHVTPSVDVVAERRDIAPTDPLALLIAQQRDDVPNPSALQCPADNGHGAHALAHRGIVAMSTPPAWPPIDAAAFRYITGPNARQLQPPTRRLHRVRARGPPVGSVQT